MSLAALKGEVTRTSDADPRTPDGFRELALTRRAALLRVAQRMAGDAGAEDLVQEALTRAYGARHTYRGEAQPFSWLCGVLLNVVRAELRRRKVRAWLSLDRCLEGGVEPTHTLDPAERLRRVEREAALRAAVADLPHAQRAALVLVSLEGLPAAEVARALGTSEAAVWKALSRGRARLREVLRDA